MTENFAADRDPMRLTPELEIAYAPEAALRRGVRIDFMNAQAWMNALVMIALCVLACVVALVLLVAGQVIASVVSLVVAGLLLYASRVYLAPLRAARGNYMLADLDGLWFMATGVKQLVPWQALDPERRIRVSNNMLTLPLRAWQQPSLITFNRGVDAHLQFPFFLRPGAIYLVRRVAVWRLKHLAEALEQVRERALPLYAEEHAPFPLPTAVQATLSPDWYPLLPGDLPPVPAQHPVRQYRWDSRRYPFRYWWRELRWGAFWQLLKHRIPGRRYVYSLTFARPATWALADFPEPLGAWLHELVTPALEAGFTDLVACMSQPPLPMHTSLNILCRHPEQPLVAIANFQLLGTPLAAHVNLAWTVCSQRRDGRFLFTVHGPALRQRSTELVYDCPGQTLAALLQAHRGHMEAEADLIPGPADAAGLVEWQERYLRTGLEADIAMGLIQETGVLPFADLPADPTSGKG